MGDKIFDYNTVLEGIIGNKLQGLLAPRQKYTGLLDFAKSDYAGDIGMGLLAQSGYSAMPTNLGSSVGTAISNADRLRTQRRVNEFSELGTMVNLKSALQNPERQIIEGADKFKYYADTGERVLPNVEAPLDTSIKEYFNVNDGSSKIFNEKSPTFFNDVKGYTTVKPEIVNEQNEYINISGVGLFHIPTQTIVNGTEKEPENFRILTPEEIEEKKLEKGKVYQINDKNNEIKSLNNGQTFNLTESYEEKRNLKQYENQLKIVGEDRKKVTNWSKERGAIERINLGLENFTSGEYADTRKFLGGVIKLFNPNANLPDLFGEGAQVAQSGINEFKRVLFDGLQNLNEKEVDTIEAIIANIGNTPYANKVIIGALKINNTTDELLDIEGRNFEAGEIDYKEYITNQAKIKKKANKEYMEFYNSSKTINTTLENEIKQNIGEEVTAFDTFGNLIQMKVEASDVWTGEEDFNGNPVIKKITGEFYAVDLEE
jgi:hypothetical protein